MHDVKFGLLLPADNFAAAKQAALRAESEGFYSVSMIDYFFDPAWRTPNTAVGVLYDTDGYCRSD